MDTVQRFEDRPTLPLQASTTGGVDALLRRLERAPSMFGRYELRGVIGAGASAVVFEGRDLRLRRRVAVKVAISDGQLDDGYRATCLREEGRILARVDHPNVVRALECGEVAGVPFLAMTRVDGVDVGRYEAITSPSVPELLAPFADFAEGLAAVHEAGFVHRDVKPSNLLVDLERERGVICDFGLAAPIPSLARRLHRSQEPSPNPLRVGTCGYRAPELEQGQLASEASDQYAFCVTLAQLLLGSAGAKALIELELTGLETSALQALSAFPEALRRLLTRGLRPRPEARHATMRELAATLRALSHQHPPAGASLAA